MLADAIRFAWVGVHAPPTGSTAKFAVAGPTQLVDVQYENTLTTSRSMRETLINTLWEPDYVQLVDSHVKHKCSDGFLYEIQWLPHKQKISELLPPHGTCYTLVSAFLLR